MNSKYDEQKDERTLYEILGIEPNATQKEIKKAYRDKSKETHPDKEDGDEEEFKLVSQAYEVLSNEERRAIYDDTGDTSEVDNHSRVIDFLANQVIPAVMKVKDVSKIDLIGEIKGQINIEFEVLLKSELTTNQEIKRLEGANKRLQIKKGVDAENVFGKIFEKVIKEKNRDLIHFEREKEFLREADKFINDYYYMSDILFQALAKPKDENSGDKKVYIGNETTEADKTK